MSRHYSPPCYVVLLLLITLVFPLGCASLRDKGDGKPGSEKPGKDKPGYEKPGEDKPGGAGGRDALVSEVEGQLQKLRAAADRLRRDRPSILKTEKVLLEAEGTEADFCADRRTLTARVIALDQQIFMNRSGASLPQGAIYALANDVVTSDTGVSCYPSDPASNPGVNPACQPGNVQLRPGKRPRPMVLRADEGDCLKINLTNLLSLANGPQPPTRAVSLHIQGMNWVDGPQDDGSWVGRNCNSQVAPNGIQANACAVSSGNATTYTLFADHEGPYLIYSRGDDYTKNTSGGDGGFLQFGLFGSLNVQPSGFEETEEYFEDFGREGVQLWNSEWYRSQVTEQDLCLASKGHSVSGGVCAWADPAALPALDYQAIYPSGPLQGFPILNMLCPGGGTVCQQNEIVHSDLTAIITGPDAGRFPDNFLPEEQPPVLRPVYSYPQRLQPYREFTIAYHESYQVAQAFQKYFTDLPALKAAQDNFGINYGMGALAPVVLGNRLGVGSATDCVECKYEEFFLTSWALGDPAMIVDHPSETCLNPDGTPIPGCRATTAYFPDDPSNVYHSYMSDHLKFRILHAGPDLHHLHHQHAHQWLGSPNSPNADYLDSQSIGPGSAFSLEMVYEGSGNLNQTVGDSIFHCHFYPHFGSGMWSLWRVHDVFEAGTRLDENGRPLTYCLQGYDKQPYTVRNDELVCPEGFALVTEARALPDGEIMAGTPTPALVPMPTLPMAPQPAPVRLVDGGKNHEVKVGDQWVSALEPTPMPWNAPQVSAAKNPGYPFFIPGIAGRRAPHPPLDTAWAYSGCEEQTQYNGSVCTPTWEVPAEHKLMELRAPAPDPTCRCDTPLDGGLPRHVMNGTAAENDDEYLLKEDPGLTNTALLPYAQTDFSKEIEKSPALQLPEEGTYVEKVAMAAHAERFHYDSQLPDGTRCGTCNDNQAPCWSNDPEGLSQCGNPFTASCMDLGSTTCSEGVGRINFVLNGLKPVPGAPYADPCIQYNRTGGAAPGGIERQYLAVDIQLDAIFNKEGWHFPQQRMISLWGDAQDFITKQKPPEPLFMRVNSYDCMNYTLANLVPNVYELDDFQVRTPTDILGQHIHLVKFDVTSSDGSANGWNYEDGTFAPNEVTERIRGINKGGWQTTPSSPRAFDALTPKTIAFFGQGPGGRAGVTPGTGAWLGAQATVQRWYDDPLYNNIGYCETDLSERCTLAENSPSSPYHCPNNGLCIPSAGFCSNDASQRCTEFDLSNCAPDAECNPLFDRTIRTVFTHDHFGPSTHQQAGLYAGVVAEPKDSAWRMNELMSAEECEAEGGTPQGMGVCIMGGWDKATSEIFPSREVTQNNVTIKDSGPTSWQAVVVPPDADTSYREFLFQAQDSTLMYEPFYTWEFVADVTSNAGRAQYYNGDTGICNTVNDEPCGFCSYTGRCSVDASIKCLMPSPVGGGVDTCGANGPCVLGTSFLTPCTTTHKDACISYSTGFEPHGVESCNYVAGIPSTTWAAGQAIGGGTPEGITFDLATDNFSYNYRNEPLFPRIDDAFTGQPFGDARGDLGNVYASLRRGNPRGYLCALNLSQACDPNATNPCGSGDADLGPCEEAGFCSTTQPVAVDNLPNYALCTTSNTTYCTGKYPSCDAITTPNQDPIPYTPLTPGVFPGDPFTPLMRAYAGDDVQIRTLTGAHINPHNMTVHGFNWLKEPSFVDSGWRNSEVTGISEHFEVIGKLNPPFSATPEDKPFTDYLYQPGLAAIEQASGNWGFIRAYDDEQDDLAQLPQNPASGIDQMAVCPTDAPVREYEVVALTVKQVLNDSNGALTYSGPPGPRIQDPNAMLFFRTDDPNLHCTANGTAPWTCSQAYGGTIEPLVLRAAAGDCIQVTLANGIDPQFVASSGVTSTPESGGTSNVSTQVGLRPQLVTHDLRTSDGTNAGFNPEQTVAPGGEAITYTWYAGHVEMSPPEGKSQYIPIEFGGSNLLPPDPLNHYRHGLFGGLVIEPADSTWTAPDGSAFTGVEAVVSYTDLEGQPATFREFVVFTQDDLQNLVHPAGNQPVNAINYASAYLGNPTERFCDNQCQNAASIDVSCTVSDAAFCLDNANPPNCTPCGSTAPAPTFAACAGENVRFRLLHPGGTNTNQVFELFGHTFSEAPYVTAEVNCEPPTTHTNLYASQFLGQINLCGSTEFYLQPAEFIQERVLGSSDGQRAGPDPKRLAAIEKLVNRAPALRSLVEQVRKDYMSFTEGGVWDASLNEWKASRMGHGPGNHFDVLLESAGGVNAVPGDYLLRSYPAMHFYPGMWGVFRVLDPNDTGGLSCHLPPAGQTASVVGASPSTVGSGAQKK